MVKVTTAAGIAGMWFIVWQIFRKTKASASMDNYKFNAEKHVVGNNASILDIYKASREANGAPARILNVSNFSFANLEVRIWSFCAHVVVKASDLQNNPCQCRILACLLRVSSLFVHGVVLRLVLVMFVSFTICRGHQRQRIRSATMSTWMLLSREATVHRSTYGNVALRYASKRLRSISITPRSEPYHHICGRRFYD